MKILYASDNIYHHMIPLANCLANLVGDGNFKYAVLKPQEKFRISMGFNPNDNNQPWVIPVFENNECLNEFEQWFGEADVVLFSNRDLFNMTIKRIENNKLTFYFSERWWKPNIGKFRLFFPKYIKLALDIKKLSKNKNFHYLAHGIYAARDIKYVSKFENRIWEFGYFTDTTENFTIKKNQEKINILWCGRMLNWKRVDVLIKAFGEVVKEKMNCHLTLIGDGAEKLKLEKKAKKILPQWSYDFFPSQSTQIIREKMNCADIFVLPSSGYEGWGAVVNEAMAEGCAVIASVETGAGKSIISNLENGILFKSGDWKGLSKQISLLVQDENLRQKIQLKGKATINEIWSPEVAATRFIKVCEAILYNKEIPIFENGPLKRFTTVK
nr:glycosyltransferase [uncultured Flavobacterium sp.]